MTLVNDDESYEEVSASCGIAAAMVNNRNPLHTKYIQKALDGILANISEDGRVLNVSGTAVMKDRKATAIFLKYGCRVGPRACTGFSVRSIQ